MALKKGVCKNFTQCTIADTVPPVIQEVDSSELFICAECEKELDEYTGEEKPPFPKRIIFIIVAAIILIGGGIWAYFGLTKDQGSQPGGPESVSLLLNKEEISLYVGESDTLKASVSTQPVNANVSVIFSSDNENVAKVGNSGTVLAISKGEADVTVIAQMETGIADTVHVKATINEMSKDSIAPVPPINDKNNPSGSSKDRNNVNKNYWNSILSFGTLDGSLSYDNNATIKVKKQYTMYLKDAKQSTIVVYPGDELRQCRIRNGILESFQVIRQNGNRESILDASEKLK